MAPAPTARPLARRPAPDRCHTDANGKVKLDVSDLPEAVADTRTSTRNAGSISNKEALMTLMEGMVLFGFGSMASGALASRRRRPEGGAGS